MTVRQLLANLDSRELSEWMAYFELENKDLANMKKDKPKALENKIKGTFTAFSGVK